MRRCSRLPPAPAEADRLAAEARLSCHPLWQPGGALRTPSNHRVCRGGSLRRVTGRTPGSPNRARPQDGWS
eukprot:15457124-Alexandrium_andersonii.AAC.1